MVIRIENVAKITEEDRVSGQGRGVLKIKSPSSEAARSKVMIKDRWMRGYY